MSYLSPEILSILKYTTPPVIGAFIGYFTNYVAIKMLFRPLTPWHLGKLRIPMTPGVIPAKRLELANNMGEVVGDHLLTSEEIGRGLQQDVFQQHISNLITVRIESILQKDLGNFASMVPKRFKVYFDIGSKTLAYQIKAQIRAFICGDRCKEIIEESLEERLDRFLERELAAVLPGSQRENIYRMIESSIRSMLAKESLEHWVEDFVHQKVYGALQKEESLADVLPNSLLTFWEDTITRQTPVLLTRFAAIISEPEVREKIVKGVAAGVENFIGSLGSMADLVRGFIRIETVEEKIHSFLVEKDDDIARWLQSETVQLRVAEVLHKRSEELFNKPIAQLFKRENDAIIEEFCAICSKQLLLILRGKDVATLVTSLIKVHIESNLDAGETRLRQIGGAVLGDTAIVQIKNWLKKEVVAILQSTESLDAVDTIVDSLLVSVMEKRWGKLAHIIPSGIKDGVVQSLQKMTSNMLASEVPGLVESLNIRKIVTDKINSLDVLRLERLLLSIMEEQFKYINIFGAGLGFLIGCFNLLLL